MGSYSKWLKYKAISGTDYAIAGIGLCRDERIVTPPRSWGGMPITAIHRMAFKNNKWIKSIVISEGVKSIGEWAFSGCAGLKSVELPSTLQSIESNAFEGCETLKEIVLPQGIKKIEYATFKDCKSLERIDLSGVEKISSYAFSGCLALCNVRFPIVPINLPISAFEDCAILTSSSNWYENVCTVDGYVVACRAEKEYYKIGKNVRCILSNALKNGRRYIKEPNPNYEEEMSEYKRQMEMYECCLELPNMEFTPPPEKCPQKYFQIPFPMQIHYEGTLAEWESISWFVSDTTYVYEIVATDGVKTVVM